MQNLDMSGVSFQATGGHDPDAMAVLVDGERAGHVWPASEGRWGSQRRAARTQWHASRAAAITWIVRHARRYG